MYIVRFISYTIYQDIMYTKEDYIQDCWLAENGRGEERDNAYVRKKYYEMGRLNKLYQYFPEYNELNSENDRIIFVASNKTYRKSDLNLDIYVKDTYPNARELRSLLLERKRLIQHIAMGWEIVKRDSSQFDLALSIIKEQEQLEEIENKLRTEHRAAMSRLKPGEY